MAEYEAALPEGGWPNWVLGNHDQPRIAARVGEAQARVAAMLLLTLRGTPTLYYGDEIGLAHVPVPPEQAQDPWGRNEPGHGRDPERTPMQWEEAPNAGFTTGTPWLPLSADAERRNVDEMRDDSRSILTLYRRLLSLRRDHPALSIGDWRGLPLSPDHSAKVFAFERVLDGEVLRILLNFGSSEWTIPLEDRGWTILLSTLPGRAGDRADGKVRLAPNEGVILKPASR
ncbi:glycosidase [Methylorubrum extorquens]|nr:glycosidase [Methylorubrum extorquens]